MVKSFLDGTGMIFLSGLMEIFETWQSSKLPERIWSLKVGHTLLGLEDEECWVPVSSASSAEMKVVWHSWGLSPRGAGCAGLGYLSLYTLEELKRISEDWRAARLLGDQECQHTALELDLHCHWEANCSTSPCNRSFMGLLSTLEKTRWYLQELKFLLKMRWSEAFSCHTAF